jgi:hypothetical protein
MTLGEETMCYGIDANLSFQAERLTECDLTARLYQNAIITAWKSGIGPF